MKKLRVIERGGQFLVKRGRIIVGFVYQVAEGARYAFGAPSQASYLAFEVPSVQVGIEKIKEFYGGY